MECRGCGKTLNQSDVRMVSRWPFCPDCFQGLLEKKDSTPAPLESRFQESVDRETPPQETAPAMVPCHLCKLPTAASLLKKVGIWMFCPGCYADLAAPAIVDEPPFDQEAPGAVAKEHADTHDKSSVETTREQVDMARFVKCAGCGRRIREAGSKVLDGESLCPDCYYNGARQTASPVEGGFLPMSSAASAHRPSTERETARCQSCDQPDGLSALTQVQGFHICRACLGTDRNLAVRIARSRRLQLLRRLEKELS